MENCSLYHAAIGTGRDCNGDGYAHNAEYAPDTIYGACLPLLPDHFINGILLVFNIIF